MDHWILIFVITLLNFSRTLGVELTFELYDNAKDCFYEVVEKNTSATLEYQVNDNIPVVQLYHFHNSSVDVGHLLFYQQLQS